MEKMSYYVYNEWFNGHLQLIQKTKNYNKIDWMYLKSWKEGRKEKIIFHIVEANSAFSARVYIIAKKLKWDKMERLKKIPHFYKGYYIKKIVY